MENQKNHVSFPSRLSLYMTEPGFKCKLSSYLLAKSFHLTTKLLYCPPLCQAWAWPSDKCLVCPESNLGGLVVNAAACPGPSLKPRLKYTILAGWQVIHLKELLISGMEQVCLRGSLN